MSPIFASPCLTSSFNMSGKIHLGESSCRGNSFVDETTWRGKVMPSFVITGNF